MSSERKYLEPPTDDQWIEFWQKLRLFTFKKYSWLKVSLGVDLEDIVNGTVADVMDGTRIWRGRVDPSSSVNTQEQELSASFFWFLCGVVKSKISHLREKAERQEEYDAFGSNVSRMGEDYAGGVSSDALGRLEDQIWLKELRDKMEQLVNHDYAAVRIIRSLSASPDLTPKEISMETGLSIEAIYNALKRIRRKSEKARS